MPIPGIKALINSIGAEWLRTYGGIVDFNPCLDALHSILVLPRQAVKGQRRHFVIV
jgi:hypothetical protein